MFILWTFRQPLLSLSSHLVGVIALDFAVPVCICKFPGSVSVCMIVYLGGGWLSVAAGYSVMVLTLLKRCLASCYWLTLTMT